MNDNDEWIPLNQREKLSISHILALAVGNFAPGLIWNIFNALFNPLVQGPSRALCSDVTPHSQQNFMAGCCQLFCGVSPIISNIVGSFEFNIANLSHDTFLIIVSAIFLFIKGKTKAMQCSIINNFVQLVYGFLNNRAVDTIGMKWLMVIGNTIMTIALLCFLFITNEYVYFGIAGLMGLGQVISMTIPHGIVSLVIPTQELAHNFGILHCFLIFGQIVSNLGIDTIVSKIVNNDDANISTYDIGYSSIFGFLAVIASFFIVQPSLADIGNYNKIGDNSGTSGTDGF